MPNNRLIIPGINRIDSSYTYKSGVNFTYNANAQIKYSYTTIDLRYKVYEVIDLSDNSIQTDSYDKKTTHDESFLSRIYDYQCIKITGENLGNYKIQASDYYNNTNDTKSIIEHDDLVPPVKFYLFGASGMNVIGNYISYYNGQYEPHRNDSGGRGGVVIGTFKNNFTNNSHSYSNVLTNGIRCWFRTDNATITSLDLSNNYFAGNVNRSTGDVNTTVTKQNTDTILEITDNGSNQDYNDKHDTVYNTPVSIPGVAKKSYNTELIYTVKDANGNSYIDNSIKYNVSDNRYTDILDQYGVESPYVPERKRASSAASSKTIGTPQYAVLIARIPYAFINMFYYFYETKYSSGYANGLQFKDTGDSSSDIADISIDINNNSVILYIPTLAVDFDKAGQNRTLREIIVEFNGNNNVIFMTEIRPETNNPNDGIYVVDNNKYKDDADHEEYINNDSRDGIYHIHYNGDRTRKYYAKVYVKSGMKYAIRMRSEKTLRNQLVNRLHINRFS